MKNKLILLAIVILVINTLSIQQAQGSVLSTAKSHSVENYVEIVSKSDMSFEHKSNNHKTLKRQTRIQRQNSRKLLPLQTENHRQTSINASFDIYSAFTELITDIDGDGFYQAFTITFDADLHANTSNIQAIVYADLYISRAGEPWTLFYSTDNFIITDNISDDAYQVETYLETGFSTGYYDILIDLIDSSSHEVLTTYSAADDNALYALPLESDDYDPEYVEVEVISVEEHGGSLSWLMLFFLFAVFISKYSQLFNLDDQTNHKNVTL